MKSTKEQVLEFLEKCDELTKCKFIMATTKIKDLLKCIVNSPELYGLFDKVTKDFNYPEQKSKCLIGGSAAFPGKVVLPQTVGQRLAFIFCLLVEFDRDTINLSDFLQMYFREDGSYFASYKAFCDTIIVGLADLVKQVFKEQLNNESGSENSGLSNSEKLKLLSTIALTVEAEKAFILTAAPKDETEGAVKMLNALVLAVRNENEDLIDALICGYNYFVLYNRCVSDNVASLIELISEFEKLL